MRRGVCKECQERRVGCHAVCAKFLAESILMDKQRRERIEKTNTGRIIDDLLIKRWIKTRKEKER